MKKTLLATLAIASMMSCSNEEVLHSPAKEAITFDNTFVDKATRAIDGSYTTGSLQAFQAYGIITTATGIANIFDGEVVSKYATGWTYDSGNTQYWIPGNSYSFSAVVDGNIENVTSVSTDENGMPTAITLHDASAQKDILYSEYDFGAYNTGDGAKSVSFIFSHLLAKAKFTFKNTITTDNGYNYKVSGITILGADKSNVYTIGEGWGEASDTYDELSFGNAVDADEEEVKDATPITFGKSMVSNYERLLIPANKALKVRFGYELLKGDAVIDTQTKNITTQAINLEAGKAYNFVISLGNPGDPITFDVTEVKGWINQETEIK